MKGQNLTIGLDIGSHSVKICELKNTKSGLQLISLGSTRLPEGAVEDGELRDSEAVALAVKTLMKNLKIKSKKVGISISGYSVILKKINLAVMGETELEEHIHSEAEQYIPFDISEVYLDFQDLKTSADDEDRTDVMLVAAKKEVVDGYLEMLQSIGLKTVLVDVDAFALENSYEVASGQEGNILLADIGSSKMNINIISGGASLFARDVAFGSRQITELIQDKFDLSFEDAEALKTGTESPGDKQKDLEEIFVSTITQWAMEIKKAMDFYNSNNPDTPLAKLVISGGGSRINGLDAFLAEDMDIPVEVFNPFADVKADEKNIDLEYLRYIAPEMTISMGLATRPVTF